MTSVLPALPYLAPWYRLAQLPGKDRARVRPAHRLPRGAARPTRLVPALLPLLDGTRDGRRDRRRPRGGRPGRRSRTCSAELADHGAARGGPAACGRSRRGRLRGCRGAARLSAARRRAGRRDGRGARAAAPSRSPAGRRRRTGGCSAPALERRPGRAVGRHRRRASTSSSARRRRASSRSCRSGTSRRSRPRRPWLQVLPFDGRYAAVGPALPPGRHVLLRVLPASARGQPGRAATSSRCSTVRPLPIRRRPRSTRSPAALAAQLALQLARSRRPLRPGGVLRARAAPDARAHASITSIGCRAVAACSGLADVAAPLPWYKEVPVAGGLSSGRCAPTPVAADAAAAAHVRLAADRRRAKHWPKRSPHPTSAVWSASGASLQTAGRRSAHALDSYTGSEHWSARPGRGGGDRRGARALLGLVCPEGAARRRRGRGARRRASIPGGSRCSPTTQYAAPASRSARSARDTRCRLGRGILDPGRAPRVPARAARLHAVAASRRTARTRIGHATSSGLACARHAGGGDPRRAARARRARRLHARLARPPVAAAARLERRRGDLPGLDARYFAPSRLAVLGGRPQRVLRRARPCSASSTARPGQLGALGVGAACAPRG